MIPRERGFSGLVASEQIADALYAHAGFRLCNEATFALPFSFEPDDHVQVLTDIAQRLGPAVGWTPGSTAADATSRGGSRE